MGYQMLAKLQYDNVFAGVNLTPTIGYSHNVKGNTPLPLGNFIEGRKSFSLGMEFVYQYTWSLDLRYVNYFGAEDFNLLNDRDYVSATVRYSF